MTIFLETTISKPQEREYEAWIVQGIEEYFERLGAAAYAIWAVSPHDEAHWPADEALAMGCKLVGLQFKQAKLADDKPDFDFDYLDKILEGMHRKGHFNGVAQVVKRFFEIIEPNKAYFGSKDYQQVLIVKALVKQMASFVEIVSCPILREPDGLAMSSRNVLLSPSERLIAGNIPKIMAEAKTLIPVLGVAKAKEYVKQSCETIPQIKLEYYEVCDTESLVTFSDTDKPIHSVALIALFVGKIRLIDNLF